MDIPCKGPLDQPAERFSSHDQPSQSRDFICPDHMGVFLLRVPFLWLVFWGSQQHNRVPVFWHTHVDRFTSHPGPNAWSFNLAVWLINCPTKNVWGKINHHWTAGFGPCLHLPGFHSQKGVVPDCPKLTVQLDWGCQKMSLPWAVAVLKPSRPRL